MYTPKARPCRFTHSLRVDALPRRFQEFVHDWARHLPREERLEYTDGEFYMVVPFEMLLVDTMEPDKLAVFTRRLNRLHHVENHEGLEQHIASYPFKKWHARGEDLDNYIEMMFMLHHLKANLPVELTRPATLAIFVHD